MTLDVGRPVPGAPSGSPHGTAPPCAHLDLVGPAQPRSAGCEQCQSRGMSWARLVVCLTCGWVACADDSPYRHAKAHYEETDHPVVGALGSERSWRWCYAD